MIACLPMYDRPELRGATDNLWSLIVSHLKALGVDAPDHLSRDPDYERMWAHPDLLVGMTCGQPYRAGLHRRTTLVGNFDYGLPDCPSGWYCSHIVTRRDDARKTIASLAGSRFAFNGRNSESGFWCMERLVDGLDSFCGELIETTAHQNSVLMVADGRADFAAIDAVTWRYIAQAQPDFAAGLKIIAKTAPTPGLPLITSRPEMVPDLAFAVKAAVTSLPKACATLGIRGFVQVPHDEFMAIQP